MMMEEMVENGEFDSLVPERVWAEFEKGLMEPHFWKLWCALDACGALFKLPFYNRACFSSFEMAADHGKSLRFRCAAMFQDDFVADFQNNRIPSEICELAMLATYCGKFISNMSSMTTRGDMLEFYTCADLFRRPARFFEALLVLKYRNVTVPEIIREWATKVLDVDAGSIALACVDKSQIKDAVAAARIGAMK